MAVWRRRAAVARNFPGGIDYQLLAKEDQFTGNFLPLCLLVSRAI
jgi:hypothetical protein